MKLQGNKFIIKNNTLILILILIIGTVLRFYGIGFHPFWLDEMLTSMQANSKNLANVLDSQHCCNPPGYMLLVYFSIKFFGDSDVIMRLPSAVSGVLSIYFIYFLAKQLYSNKEGLISAAIMAVLMCPVYYSQEARPYSMLVMSVILASYYWICILKSLDEADKVSFYTVIGYIIFAAISSYAHYFGLYLIALQCVWSLILFINKRRARLYILTIYFLILLAYLPWFTSMKAHSKMNNSIDWIIPPEPSIKGFIRSLFEYISSLFNYSNILLLLVGVFYLFLILSSLFKIVQAKEPINSRKILLSPGMLLSLWLFIPFIGVYIISVLSTPVLLHRYLMISLPAAYILLARSITQLSFNQTKQMVVTLILTIVFVYHLIFVKNYYTEPYKDQYSPLIKYVLEREIKYKNAYIMGTGWILNYYFNRQGSNNAKFLGLKTLKSFLSDENSENKIHYLWYLNAHFTPNNEYLDFLNKNLKLIDYKIFLSSAYSLYGDKGLKAELWLYENENN